MRLVLASASPRRRQLLTAAGFSFDVVTTDVDEGRHAGETPDAYVKRLASSKSARGLELLSMRDPFANHELVVLGADTAVVVEDDVLGKPSNEQEARRMLERLSGRVHRVLTGLSVRTAEVERAAVESTEVWFARLSAEDIDWYASTGEGNDKAGAYGIQGLASRFIPRIQGSYTNVVGLPVAAVYRLLNGLGVPTDAVASGG
ncbi:MAG: nucleoside triphosphate pyrophosphatase [Vicinamibacterales bacterium]